MFPASSTARTLKVWPPSAWRAYVFGLLQLANARESSLHRKATPGSLSANSKVGVLSFGLGVPVIVGAGGGVVSITHEYGSETAWTREDA